MSSLPPVVLQTADAVLGSPRGATPLVASLRRTIAHSLARLTWQRLLWTCAFCAAYGLLLGAGPQGGAPQSVLAWLGGFTGALSFFMPPLVVVSLVAEFAPKRIVPRTIVLALGVAVGIAVGYRLFIAADALAVSLQIHAVKHTGSPLPLLLMAWIGLAIHLSKERENAAEQALHDETERKLNLERQMSEAQLQVLQSQIEPHFLFNSLAHVRRLYQTDPAAGRAMLRYLSSYLGAAQPVIRERGIALATDLELAVAYLNIQRIRMGSRLAFEIDIPDVVRPTIVPPMMLTTLVENAIKHGLSPLPEGGLVRIAAHAETSCVRIIVSDTGQGFKANLGVGVGLANIRSRLAILYADAATLSLSQRTPKGITATVVVPARYPGVPR
ncbi:MAG TPA: histidine kinase [Casimicrobiaceae bacterium]|nr:histidine kinase [Casimicrobiaceae bacterium]